MLDVTDCWHLTRLVTARVIVHQLHKQPTCSPSCEPGALSESFEHPWRGALKPISSSANQMVLNGDDHFFQTPAAAGVFGTLPCMEVLTLAWPERWDDHIGSSDMKTCNAHAQTFLLDCMPAHGQLLWNLLVLIITVCSMRGIIRIWDP